MAEGIDTGVGASTNMNAMHGQNVCACSHQCMTRAISYRVPLASNPLASLTSMEVSNLRLCDGCCEWLLGTIVHRHSDPCRIFWPGIDEPQSRTTPATIKTAATRQRSFGHFQSSGRVLICDGTHSSDSSFSRGPASASAAPCPTADYGSGVAAREPFRLCRVLTPGDQPMMIQDCSND